MSLQGTFLFKPPQVLIKMPLWGGWKLGILVHLQGTEGIIEGTIEENWGIG